MGVIKGKTSSLAGQLSVTHLFYKVKQRIKTVQCPKQFILFFGDPVFASQIKTKEDLYRATLTLVSRSVLSHPSLVQSQIPDQRIKTVQYPKQFFPFFWGPSLCITDQD